MSTESILTETFIDKNGKIEATSSDMISAFFQKIGPLIEIEEKTNIDYKKFQYWDAHDLENEEDDFSTILDKIDRKDDEKKQTASRPQLESDNKPFNVIQKWEGKVLDVGEETFTAELVPLKGEEGELITEIYIDEQVDEDDLSLLRPGSIFYWTIGYKKDPYTRTISFIRFRRIPPVTKGQLLKANLQTSKLKAFFNGNKSTNTAKSK